MSKSTVITYPKGFPQMLKMSDADFANELTFLAAAKLYELGRISSGNAAKLAGPYWVQVSGAAHARAQKMSLDLVSLRLVDYAEAQIRHPLLAPHPVGSPTHGGPYSSSSRTMSSGTSISSGVRLPW
jgi:hypothetical protein